MIKVTTMNVGILGAGQLAQMLALEGAPLGLKVHVLAGKNADPAASTALATIGDPNHPQVVARFAENLDLLTFESEFIDAAGLQKSLSLARARIFPSLNSLAMFQDRKPQKEFLDRYNIPTAPWISVSDTLTLGEAARVLGHRFVLKLRMHGYDGKGTFFCRSKADLQKMETLLEKYPQGFIAEKLQKFKRELAVMLARSADGSTRVFPLVQSWQKENRCDLVLGPVRHRELEKLSRRLLQGLARENYVGVMGVEIFEVDDHLVVNELAPRVHNSGHYSQTALNISQFKMHWLCGLGEKLPGLRAVAPSFGMINLIGKSDRQPELYHNIKSTLHWYNKSPNQPGRKMGHLNAVGKNLNEIKKQLVADRRKYNL